MANPNCLHAYFIATDSAMTTIDAPDADTAAREFARSESAPSWVQDVESLERWLRRVGGYGSMTGPDDETLFDIPC